MARPVHSVADLQDGSIYLDRNFNQHCLRVRTPNRLALNYGLMHSVELRQSLDCLLEQHRPQGSERVAWVYPQPNIVYYTQGIKGRSVGRATTLEAELEYTRRAKGNATV